MAIYHFSAKTVSRKAGQSAVAKAAYNARDKLADERTGEVKDYSRKGGLLFSGIYAPKDAPEWAHDRAQLWNHAEAAEKRKDSTLAREYQIALPHELTDEQRRYLVQDFVKENFTRKGYAADVNIHAPDRDGDERNYHAHVLVTDRRLEANGFAASKAERQGTQKARAEELEALRESWERLGNRHLERHGHAPTLDRRTLEAQGIDREPTQHLGPNISAMQRRGINTDRYADLRKDENHNRELAEARAALDETSREIEASGTLAGPATADALRQFLRDYPAQDLPTVEQAQGVEQGGAQRPEPEHGFAAPSSHRAFALGDSAQVTRLNPNGHATEGERHQAAPESEQAATMAGFELGGREEKGEGGRETVPEIGRATPEEREASGATMEQGGGVNDGMTDGVGGGTALLAKAAERVLDGVTSLLEGFIGAASAPTAEERRERAQRREEAAEEREMREKIALYRQQMEDSDKQQELSRRDGGRERTRER